MATKEKMVFTKNYGKFCDFLKHEVTLLPKFVEERIISGDHEEVIRNTAVTQRGQALLAHISGPLDGGQTGGFYIMLEIMKQHGKPDTQEFVNSIELELQGGRWKVLCSETAYIPRMDTFYKPNLVVKLEAGS